MTVCHTHFFAPCQVPHKPDKMDDADPALDVQAALQDLLLKIRGDAYMLAPEWIQHAKPRQYLPGRAGIFKSIMEICRKLLRLQAAKQLECLVLSLKECLPVDFVSNKLCQSFLFLQQ